MTARLVTIAILCFAFASGLEAQTAWTGNLSTDWFTAANWTAGVPGPNDDVRIPGGRPRYPVLTGNNARCRDLEIRAGGSLDVAGFRVRIFDDLSTVDPDAISGPGELRFDRGSPFDVADILTNLDFDGDIRVNKRGRFRLRQNVTANQIEFRRGLSQLGGGTHLFTRMIVERRAVILAENSRLDIDGDVTIEGWLIDVSASGADTVVAGDWVCTGLHTTLNQRVIFDGGGTSTIRALGTGDFARLRVENGTTVELLTDVHATDDVFVSGNTLRVSPGRRMRIDGDLGITGLFDVEAGSTLALGNGSLLTVLAGGAFEAIGDPPVNGDLALVTSIAPTARYGFRVIPGGVIRAAFAYFRFMNAGGIEINDSPSVVALERLEHTIFDNGAPGGRLLRLVTNDDAVTLSSLQFFDTNGNLAFNVETFFASASILIDPYDDDTNGTGFGGPANENDNGGGTVNPGSIVWGTVTPVVFRDLTATTDGTEVAIDWSTESEWRIAGFELERTDGPDSAPVTFPWTVAHGSPGRAGTYRVWDACPPLATTTYALWALDLAGRRSLVARCTPRVGATPIDLDDPDDSGDPAGSGASSTAFFGPPTGPTGGTPTVSPTNDLGRVEIRPGRAGVFTLDPAVLASLGFELSLPRDHYRLSYRGQAWPFTIEGGDDGRFDPGDRLVSIAPHAEDLETSLDPLLLEVSARPSPELPTETAAPSPLAPIVEGTVTRLTRANNSIYVAALPPVESQAPRDHFFDAAIIAPGTDTTWVEIDRADPVDGTLAVQLEAFTHQPLSIVDHEYAISFAGVEVDRFELNGCGPFSLETTIPSVLLTDGTHPIEITAEETGAPSIAFIESVVLEYHRRPTGRDDRVQLEVPASAGERTVVVDEFASDSLRVFRLANADGNPSPTELIEVEITRGPLGRWSVRFSVPPEGGRFEVASTEELVPAQVLAGTPDLIDPVEPIDLVIITPHRFLSDLEPLIDRRRAQGWSTYVATTEAVYTTFGGGRPNSTSLQTFLRHAYLDWPEPRPTHVLLVGDATFDPRGNLGATNRQIVPTRLIESRAFETASDARLVDVVGDDGLPDFAVGRLPIATAAECQAMVAKLLGGSSTITAGPSSAASSATPIATLIADIDPRFAALNQRLAAQLEPTFGTVTTAIDPSDSDVARDALEDAWLDSSLLVYTGHGSRLGWSATDLLRVQDIPATTGAPIPLVISFNCTSAYFHHPDTPSLAEALVTASTGGARCYFGPTTVTSHPGQAIFAEALVRRLSDPAHSTIGDAILAAQSELGAIEGLQEILATWVLLGDPTTPIPR